MNIEDSDDEDDILATLGEACLLDLFEMGSDHFIKIILSDNLKLLKESLPKTKKLALRASLAGTAKRQKVSTTKASAPSADSASVKKRPNAGSAPSVSKKPPTTQPTSRT